MKKSDVVKRITEKTGLPRLDVVLSVEAFINEIKAGMVEGKNIYIRGFGSFVVKTRKKKIGRIISNNTAIEIPERKVPFFKPAKIFSQRVQRGNSPKII